MPRMARRNNPDTPHHIMCRSISEIRLFRNDNDKIKYLELMALYCEKFECSILAYCLMDTHVHIQFDPQGADISKFMHGLNLCYAQYYNRKYNRHGHVFQNRFINKVIDIDEYNLIVSAYIHNNPKDLPDFHDCVDKYFFSSYGIYLGQNLDEFGLINSDFILSQFGKNPKEARVKYAEFVSSCTNVVQKEKLFEIIDEYIYKEPYEYRSEKIIYPRLMKSEDIINAVSEFFHIEIPDFIHIKYCRNVSSYRAISVFLMRNLCDMSYKEICKIVGNVTLSQVSNLSNKGFNLIKNNPYYQELYPKLLERIKVA